MLVTQCHVLSTNHNRTDKFHRWCQGVKTSEKASRDPGCCILLKNVTVHAHENFLRTTQRPRKKKLLMHIRETVKALVLCMAIRNDVFACRYSAKSPSWSSNSDSMQAPCWLSESDNASGGLLPRFLLAGPLRTSLTWTKQIKHSGNAKSSQTDQPKHGVANKMPIFSPRSRSGKCSAMELYSIIAKESMLAWWVDGLWWFPYLISTAPMRSVLCELIPRSFSKQARLMGWLRKTNSRRDAPFGTAKNNAASWSRFDIAWNASRKAWTSANLNPSKQVPAAQLHLPDNKEVRRSWQRKTPNAAWQTYDMMGLSLAAPKMIKNKVK